LAAGLVGRLGRWVGSPVVSLGGSLGGRPGRLARESAGGPEGRCGGHASWAGRLVRLDRVGLGAGTLI
jgi:hypothetical protein